MNDNEEDYDFEFEDEPICPYCKEEFSGEKFETDLYVEGETEIRCNHCSEYFIVSVNIFYSYCTCKKELEEVTE